MAVPTSAPLSTDDAFWADADRHLIRYAGAGSPAAPRWDDTWLEP